MAVSQRYQPGHPADQAAVYGVDLSNILPPGVGILLAATAIFTNTSPPVASSDFTQTGRAFRGRRAWVTLSGGSSGTDYRVQWTVTDNQTNTWIITALLLCAATS